MPFDIYILSSPFMFVFRGYFKDQNKLKFCKLAICRNSVVLFWFDFVSFAVLELSSSSRDSTESEQDESTKKIMVFKINVGTKWRNPTLGGSVWRMLTWQSRVLPTNTLTHICLFFYGTKRRKTLKIFSVQCRSIIVHRFSGFTNISLNLPRRLRPQWPPVSKAIKLSL